VKSACETQVPGSLADVAAPLLIVVTGPPASGKSSAARTIATELEIPFLSKDELKERLYDVFGSGDELERKIEDAALATLFSVAASQLRAGVSILLESNFDARSDTGPLLRLQDEQDARIVQVHIGGDTDALVEKFARRAAKGDRHPGHGDDPGDAEEVRARLEAGQWEPLELPGALVRADMDDDEHEIVEHVRRVCDR
jgi:predicted kinase